MHSRAVQQHSQRTFSRDRRAGIASVMLLATCFLSSNSPAQEAVVFGGSEFYPPLHYRSESGRALGYDVDIVRAIARETGMRLSFQFSRWENIQQALLTGEVDMVPMFVSAERADRYLFSEPYRVESHVLIGMDNQPGHRDLSSLAGQRVAAENASFALRELQLQDSTAELVPAASEAQALMMAARGEVDLALVPLHVARYTLAAEGLDSLVALSPPLLPVTYAFALNPARPELLEPVNSALDTLQRDGTLEQLRQQWLDQLMPLSFRERISLTIWLLLPALLLALAAILMSWMYYARLRRVHADMGARDRLLHSLQARLKEIGHKDPLTDLPNRERFEQLLQKRLEYKSTRLLHVAVAVMSLRDKEMLAERYGQGFCDHLQQDLSTTLKVQHKGLCGAQSDGRFLLAFEDLINADAAIARVNRLIAMARPHVQLQGRLLDLPLCVGLVFFPEHGSAAPDLLRKAGLSLGRAIADGQQVLIYRQEMEAEADTALAS